MRAIEIAEPRLDLPPTLRFTGSVPALNGIGGFREADIELLKGHVAPESLVEHVAHERARARLQVAVAPFADARIRHARRKGQLRRHLAARREQLAHRLHGTPQIARVSRREFDACAGEAASASACVANARLGQRGIAPALDQVFQVVFRLPMANDVEGDGRAPTWGRRSSRYRFAQRNRKTPIGRGRSRVAKNPCAVFPAHHVGINHFGPYRIR